MRLLRQLKLEAVSLPSRAFLLLNLCDSCVILPEKKVQAVWTLRLYESKIRF
jgi:hypothetical protein